MNGGTAGDGLVTQLRAALPVTDQGHAEFTERELVIVDLARRQMNDIETLENLLAEQGATVVGSMKQPRLNPIFAELRQSRIALSRILAELRMPDEGFSDGKNVRKQRAANHRWGNDQGFN